MADRDIPAVSVRDLVKRYPKRPVNAVDGLTFEVSPGEIFGLLGPNGAGKTTTVGVLTTMVRATSGSASVAESMWRSIRSARGRDLPWSRSAATWTGRLPRAAEPGVPCRLSRGRPGRAQRESRPATRSVRADRAGRHQGRLVLGGMAQRLMIARALMHEPEVLFLDEPTTGLDPQARLFVWDRIRELRERGVTIVLTTHDMDEAADLADRVGIVDHGRLLALDTPEAAHPRAHRPVGARPGGAPVELDQPHALVAALEKLDGVERAEQVATGRECRPPWRAAARANGRDARRGAGCSGFPAAAGPNGRDGAGPDLRIGSTCPPIRPACWVR